jgi:tRNA(fMet)-specific endonuclease VapC
MTMSRLAFSDNDLWIAAIALCHGRAVVTADRDFDRMAQVVGLSVETWWSPVS